MATKRHKEEAKAAAHALALVFDENGGGQDFIMQPGHDSAWVTVDGISIYILRTRDGVRVELYPHFHEACCDALDSCEAQNSQKETADKDHTSGE